MPCDIQTYLDGAPCYTGLNPVDLEMVKIGLLCAAIEHQSSGTPVDCDVQTLLDATLCFRSLYPDPLTAVEAQLVLNLAGLAGIPPLDPCFSALDPWELQLLITSLLCTIIEILDGGASLEDCDIQTLLDEATCYNTLPPFLLQALQAAMLCYIAQHIGSVTPPVAEGGLYNPEEPGFIGNPETGGALVNPEAV